MTSWPDVAFHAQGTWQQKKPKLPGDRFDGLMLSRRVLFEVNFWEASLQRPLTERWLFRVRRAIGAKSCPTE
jgi:hypothetical protein